MQLVLIVKPSHHCNMNCTYCYDRDKRIKQHAVMTLEGCEQILKTFVGKYDRIVWNWHGGEPLLMNPETFYKPFYEDILPKYLHKGTEFDFCMQTNLTLLNDKQLEWLNKYDVSIGTSHDGITNAQTRLGGGLWEKKAELYNNSGPDHELGVGMTVTAENCTTLVESYKYLRQYTGSVFFSPVFGWHINKENTDKILKGLEDLLYYLLTETNDPILRPFDMPISWVFGEKPHMCEDSGCLGRWYGIDPNLDVFPCGRNWSEEYKLGNLWTDSAIDLQKSAAFNFLKHSNEHLLPVCMECNLFTMCNCGCYNTRYLQAGSMVKHDVIDCYYKQELHKMVTRAMFANFDKITNTEFLKQYGDKIRRELKEGGQLDANG